MDTGGKTWRFLNSFTTGNFHEQGMELNSIFPPARENLNYFPEQFENFMDENIQEWINLGVVQQWHLVKITGSQHTISSLSLMGWT